jgi:hypothetical protein
MKNDGLLSAMRQVEEVSGSVHTTSWIWGGLTADIHHGCFLREHDDLDYLTLHLHELIEPLSRRFQEAGWQAQQLSNGDLKMEKSAVEVRLGHIALTQEICWAHNGDLGSLFFPENRLVQEPKRFYDIDIHVIAPELQYVLLEHPELLNPDWESRDKDTAARARLKTMLGAKGVPVDGLRALIHQ